MNDLMLLLQVLGSIALLVVPPVVLARLIAGSGSGSLAELLRMTSGPPRPRGVEEDDQPPFRLDHRHQPPRPFSLDGAKWAQARVPPECTSERAA